MRSKRFGSALLVMSATLATLGSLSVAGYCTGRNLDAGRRLLDPSRAPTTDEAALAYVADYSLQSNEANDVIFLGDSAWENVPFIARRGAVRLWFPAIRNKPLMGLERETYFTLETKNLRSRGFFPLPGDRGPGNGIPMYTPEMAVRPEWTDGCARIANLCDASGCKFLILFGPLPNGLKGARDWALLDKWGRSFEAAHRCTTVGTPLFYDDRIMWDALHVNRLGVEKFTVLVAKDVQAALGK